MRVRITLLTLFLLFGSQLFAQVPRENFGDYGIPKYSSLDEYKKLIGSIVFYLPANPISSLDKSSFKGKYNEKYEIIKVSGNNRNITLTLKRLKNPQTIKVDFIIEEDGFVENKLFISENYTVPLFLIDKFVNDVIFFKNRIHRNEILNRDFEIQNIYYDYSKLCLQMA